MSSYCVKLWQFSKAPAKYRALVNQESRPDFIAFVPVSVIADAPEEIKNQYDKAEGDFGFGLGRGKAYTLENGDVVIAMG